MAGGWPINLDVCNGNDNGTVTTTSVATVVTASASANTKGSYTQIVAATAYDACFALVTIGPQNTTNDNYGLPALVDIATGASGSEQVLISNLMSNGAGYYQNMSVMYAFPLCIPAGTRIAARTQSAYGSNAVSVQVTLFDGSFSQSEGCALVDAYGPVTGSSTGTTVTAGAANTKGSYAQLTASTTADLCGIAVAFDAGSNQNSYDYLVDIAIGPAGSEVVILPNLMVCGQSNGGYGPVPNNTPFIPINIPAGTRIAARCQSSTASKTINVSAYGARL